MKKIPKEVENKIIELYKDGESIKSISIILNQMVKPTTVYNILKRNQINTRNNGGIYNLNIEQIKEMYFSQNMSIDTISNTLDVDKKTIYTYFHKNNVDLKLQTEYKNPNLNHNFFQTIDNEVKSYFIGFILADGCVTHRSDCNSHSLQISINSKDAYILEKLNEHIGSSNILSYNKNKNLTKFAIHSHKICSDLKKYGIVPKKTLIAKLPNNIDEHLMCHLIRGLIDGDGWISKRLNGTYNISLCGTEELVTQVRNYLTSKLGLYNVKVCVSNTKFENPAYFISYCSKKDVTKLTQYLYKDATIYLTRKYDKVKELL